MNCNNDAVKKIEKDLEYWLVETSYSFRERVINELKQEGVIKRLSEGITSDSSIPDSRTPEEILSSDMYYHKNEFLKVLSIYFKNVNVLDLYKSENIRKMALILLLKKYNLNYKYADAISWKKEGIELECTCDLDLADPFLYSGKYKVDIYFGKDYLCSDIIYDISYKKRHGLERLGGSSDFYDLIYDSDNFTDALINKFIQEIGFNKKELMLNKKIAELEQIIQDCKTAIDNLKNSAANITVNETADQTVNEIANETSNESSEVIDYEDDEIDKEFSNKMQLIIK